MTDTTFWCELAWLGGGAVEGGVVFEVRADRLGEIRTGVSQPPPQSVRLDGLTVPAFANAHSHAFHRALRGRTHGERGSFWTWRDLMYRVAGRLDPDSYHRLARAVFAEMALAGVGAVGEFHYVHHRPDGRPYGEHAMEQAIIAAAAEAGLRLTLLDTLYLHGGLGPDGYTATAGGQLRFDDHCPARWAERATSLSDATDRSAVRIGAAVHSVRAVDPQSITAAAELARDLAAPLHVHVSEQPLENEQCIEAHGRTPIGLLAAAGALRSTTTLVHATHASSDDIGLIAESGAGVCLCPTTERDLADGIGPSAALAAADVPLCLGSDSHAVIDLLDEARTVELDQRVVTNQRGVHQAPELLGMATANGYRALGWSDGGELRHGALADFATIGLDSVRLAGTDHASAIGAAVFSATAADVRHLVVGGNWVVRDGVHGALDVAAELAAATAEVSSA